MSPYLSDRTANIRRAGIYSRRQRHGIYRGTTERTAIGPEGLGGDVSPPYDGCIGQPRATSSIIMRLKPTAKKTVPILECSPSDISGISSSTTT